MKIKWHLIKTLVGVIIITITINACINGQNSPTIIKKDANMEIILDSFNLYSELSFCGMYFRVINRSDESVILNFNHETDTCSKHFIVMVTPVNDTIPIWYPDVDLKTKYFLPNTVTSFIGMIEKGKIKNNYLQSMNRKKSDGNFFQYIEEVVVNSKILYIPKYSNSTKMEYPNLDTIVLPNLDLLVNVRKLKFVYHSDIYSIVDEWKFISKDL